MKISTYSSYIINFLVICFLFGTIECNILVVELKPCTLSFYFRSVER